MPGNKKTKRKPKRERILDGNPDHKAYVTIYRKKVTEAFTRIREGTIAEDELDRLQNFCQMALRLMERTPLTALSAMWRDTEIFALAHDEDGSQFQDHAIVLDPAKQPPAEGQAPLPGRLKDSIDEWVDQEFSRYEALDSFEQATVRNAARMASGVTDVHPDQVLAGNTHNTTELAALHADLMKTVPDASTRFIHDGMEYKLFGFLWHGHKVILCDDGIGVFVSRNTAREIHKTYHKETEHGVHLL